MRQDAGVLRVRPFVEADRDAVADIYCQSRRQSFHWQPVESIALGDFTRDTEGESVWVACVHEWPVGFISVWMPDHFIHHLFVLPDHFRQGVGSALLAHVLPVIGRPAALKCVTANTVARDFYLAQGWRIESQAVGPDGPYLLMHHK